MIKRELYSSRYLEWMGQLVNCDGVFESVDYIRLFNYLNRVEFVYQLPMDHNRASDGVELRYRFKQATGESADPVLVAFFGDKTCSVMEMIAALALRCEETIMCDGEIGDRTGVWFWGMICSLGIQDMTNKTFNEPYVSEVLSKWMNRDFQPSGEGSLFTVTNTRLDLRDVDIWYQMNWYLETII